MVTSSHLGLRLVVALGLAAAFLALPAWADLTPPLTVQWIQSMGAEPDNDFPPLLVGDRVLVTHDGKLYCFDTLTGERQWEAAIEDQRVSTAPLAWKDTVILGLDSGVLGAVKVADKSVVWQTDCGGRIAPSPMVVNGALIVGSEQTVLALDPDTGKTKWACTLRSPARYGPMTDGSMLYFRCQDGSLQSIDVETGRFRWRAAIPFGPEGFPPVIAGGRVIATAGDTLHAIARTGVESWRAEMPAGIGGPITVVEETIYVPCVDGHIYTLYARSGRAQRGTEYRVDGSVTAMPLITDSLVVVGTSDALVYVLDRATGAARWVYRCRAPEQPLDDAAVFGVYAPLAATGNTLYALTGGGDLYSFTANAPDAAAPEFAELRPTPGDALGKDSVTVSFTVLDDGCGVKGEAVTLSVDGKLLPLTFDAPSGVATALFSKPEDGVHVVTASATDYRGNTGSKEWSFLTDESLTLEQQEEQNRLLQGRPGQGATTRGRTGGQQGGARGGGGG